MSFASISDAEGPRGIVDSSPASGLTPLYQLADAKNALALDLEQTDQDSYLLHLIGQAQAVLEETTGMRLRNESGAVAEYVLDYRRGALCITESDVVAVTAVKEYDNGTETTLAPANYDVKRSNGRTYVVRTDDGVFEQSKDGTVSQTIEFSRGVQENTDYADLVRAGMNFLVRELFEGRGTTSTDRLWNNQSYLRVIRLLQSQKSNM